MIWVFLRDQVVQLPDGQKVVSKEGRTVVLDSQGLIVAGYDTQVVLLYTKNEKVAKLLQSGTESR